MQNEEHLIEIEDQKLLDLELAQKEIVDPTLPPKDEVEVKEMV